MKKVLRYVKYYYLIAKDKVFNFFNRDIELLLLDYVKFLLKSKKDININFLKDLKETLKNQSSFKFTALGFRKDDEYNLKIEVHTEDDDIRGIFKKYKGEYIRKVKRSLNNNGFMKGNEDEIIENIDNLFTNFLLEKVDHLIQKEEDIELDDDLSNYVKTIKKEDTVLYNKDYIGETIIKLQVKSEFPEQVKKFPYFYTKYKADKFSKKFDI